MNSRTKTCMPWLALIALSIVANASLSAAPADGSKVQPEDIYSGVVEKAKKLAKQDYAEPPTVKSPEVADMSYQEYRSIRFKPEKALWRDQSLFEVQLFHTGFLYNEPVQINIVEPDSPASRLLFDSSYFSYDGKAARYAEMMPDNAGYAGFRVHYPLNTDEYKDEFIVFQGASYFRLVGPGHVYGLSARGLAVDTAEPNGEEFPAFREFWLVKPGAEDTRLTIYALLDSPSITGAYRFVLSPGVPTSMDVEARLFPRQEVKKLGIAPLTSMFHFGENSTRFYDDFRPEVHDSDGLQMRTAQGEWIWRPLTNPRGLKVTSLQDKNPGGFGLVQRDRAFDSYLDIEAHYHDRPSLWVAPEGEWGEGRVELVEIPTDSETNDNIVSYWVPRQAVKPGQELTYKYRLRAFDATLPEHDKARVVRTRIGWAALPGQDNPPPRSERQFIVDFHGGELQALAPEMPLKAHLQTSSGEYRDLTVVRLPNEATWRVSFKLKPNDEKPADMRLFIALRDQRLSEVWSYVWYPDAIQ